MFQFHLCPTIACRNKRLHYTKYVLLNYWWRKVFETCGTDIQYRRNNKRSHAYESIFCRVKCNTIFLSVCWAHTLTASTSMQDTLNENLSTNLHIFNTKDWWKEQQGKFNLQKLLRDYEISLEEFARTVRYIFGFLLRWKLTYSKVF